MREEHRRYKPLPADHPAVTMGILCVGCDEPFKEGDVTTLVVIGPGADGEAREKARSGGYYNAVAKMAHYSCVTGA